MEKKVLNHFLKTSPNLTLNCNSYSCKAFFTLSYFFDWGDTTSFFSNTLVVLVGTLSTFGRDLVIIK